MKFFNKNFHLLLLFSFFSFFVFSSFSIYSQDKSLNKKQGEFKPSFVFSSSYLFSNSVYGENVYSSLLFLSGKVKQSAISNKISFDHITNNSNALLKTFNSFSNASILENGSNMYMLFLSSSYASSEDFSHALKYSFAYQHNTKLSETSSYDFMLLVTRLNGYSKKYKNVPFPIPLLMYNYKSNPWALRIGLPFYLVYKQSNYSYGVTYMPIASLNIFAKYTFFKFIMLEFFATSKADHIVSKKFEDDDELYIYNCCAGIKFGAYFSRNVSANISSFYNFYTADWVGDSFWGYYDKHRTLKKSLSFRFELMAMF